MSPVEWYYARDNKQAGPVSSLELKQLAAAGGLRSDDLVWREGMTEWSVARNVRGLFEEAVKPAAADESPAAAATSVVGVGVSTPAVSAAPMRHPFDALMDWFRPRLDARFVDAAARFFRACGFYGLLAAMVLSTVLAVIVAVEVNVLDGLLSGAVALLVLIALQYAAGKFCDALERLNLAAEGSLPSSVFPDSFAVLSKTLGVVALFWSIVAAVETSIYLAIPFGIAAFLIFGYLAVVAMNPATVRFSIGAEAGASEEAIGVLTFLVKALMRVVPVAFGTGAICGVLLLGYACYLPFSGEGGLSVAQITWKTAVYGLIFSAALPLAAYLIFLLYSLLLDLCRAVLVLPSKFDEQAEKDEPIDPIDSNQ